MIRVWLIPFSTNVERVSLALAHKGVEAEAVEVDPDDRGEVERVSGQELVPVADFDGEIVADSPAILRRDRGASPRAAALAGGTRAARRDGRLHRLVQPRLEGRRRTRSRRRSRAGRPTSSRSTPTPPTCPRRSARSRRCSTGGPYLFGDELSAADCVAFPFLKYAAMRDPADDELFHRVLEDYQELGDAHPNVAAWIERVNGHPRALP